MCFFVVCCFVFVVVFFVYTMYVVGCGLMLVVRWWLFVVRVLVF